MQWGTWSWLAPCAHRCPVEPVLVWRREDDHHPWRSVHADQHRHHSPLGLEQHLAPGRTQSQVPVVPPAPQHHRLLEVSNESNAPHENPGELSEEFFKRDPQLWRTVLQWSKLLLLWLFIRVNNNLWWMFNQINHLLTVRTVPKPHQSVLLS